MDCRVTVVVAADRQRVWERWTDLDRWPEWNRSCVAASIGGPLEPGTRLDLHLLHPRGRDFYTRPAITEVDAPGRIAWRASSAGGHSQTVVTFTPTDEGGTQVVLMTASGGPLGFTFRMMMRPRIQAALYIGMLNDLAVSFL